MRHLLTAIGLLGCLLLPGGAFGHEAPAPGEPVAEGAGLEEKTGTVLPPGLTFRNEQGATVPFGDLLAGKPAILTLVYYTCEHICPLMLNALAQALPRLSMTAGKDYRLITVSFDAEDTPGTAQNMRKNYLRDAGPLAAQGGWTFLVGDRENIGRLTRAAGFSFRRQTHGFDHPVALFFLTPQGKISQVLRVTKFGYGAETPIAFSSFDLNVGLAQASQGREVTGLSRAILYCFSHEPPGQSRFFAFVAAIGLVTLLAMAALFIYLQVTTARARRGKEFDLER